MENFPKLPQTFEATDCPDGIPLRDFDCTLKNCSQDPGEGNYPCAKMGGKYLQETNEDVRFDFFESP